MHLIGTLGQIYMKLAITILYTLFSEKERERERESKQYHFDITKRITIIISRKKVKS